MWPFWCNQKNLRWKLALYVHFEKIKILVTTLSCLKRVGTGPADPKMTKIGQKSKIFKISILVQNRLKTWNNMLLRVFGGFWAYKAEVEKWSKIGKKKFSLFSGSIFKMAPNGHLTKLYGLTSNEYQNAVKINRTYNFSNLS